MSQHIGEGSEGASDPRDHVLPLVSRAARRSLEVSPVGLALVVHGFVNRRGVACAARRTIGTFHVKHRPLAALAMIGSPRRARPETDGYGGPVVA